MTTNVFPRIYEFVVNSVDQAGGVVLVKLVLKKGFPVKWFQ